MKSYQYFLLSNCVIPLTIFWASPLAIVWECQKQRSIMLINKTSNFFQFSVMSFQIKSYIFLLFTTHNIKYNFWIRLTIVSMPNYCYQYQVIIVIKHFISNKIWLNTIWLNWAYVAKQLRRKFYCVISSVPLLPCISECRRAL